MRAIVHLSDICIVQVISSILNISDSRVNIESPCFDSSMQSHAALAKIDDSTKLCPLPRAKEIADAAASCSPICCLGLTMEEGV